MKECIILITFYLGLGFLLGNCFLLAALIPVYILVQTGWATWHLANLYNPYNFLMLETMITALGFALALLRKPKEEAV